MYYDPADLRAKSSPFQVLFVAGGHDQDESLAANKPETFPLSSLYFCDSCSRIVSKKDLSEDVDSYYCPHCLENMPSSEAMLCGMRCSKCWECPVCSSTLTPCIANPSFKEQTYHFACSYCRWSSKGRQEADKPEQLITEIVSLERESQPRQRMMAMLEAFRTKAQEQQREKELAQRLKRRASARASFSAASLTAFAARRFSAAVGLRQHARLPGTTELTGESKKGQWNVEDLEAKLAEQAEKSTDLRAEAYLLAESAKNAPEASPISSPEAKDSPSKRFSFSSAAGVEGPPVLAGLSVEELLRSHREALPNLEGQCLLDELQNSIDTDTTPQTQSSQGACASQSMRLSQISYGYHGVSVKPPTSSNTSGAGTAGTKGSTLVNGLHKGQSQLEAPLQHRNAWKLLPLRKPLLTKRSRRCKLLSPGETSEAKTCKGLVVKPQINPCANPPFQKNSVAMNFVPRCLPWSCREDAGNYELVLILANPMESDVELQLDPSAFNGGKAGGYGSDWSPLLSQQNVEVSTSPFSTVIPKFLDLTEATEVFEDEAKQLQQQDDPDVILDRKLNKILVRLRFRKVESPPTPQDASGGRKLRQNIGRCQSENV